MKRREGNGRGSELSEIEREFKKFRGLRGRQRSHCPMALKELALSAEQVGYSMSEIAIAAGVSPKTIVNWRKTLGSGSARCKELRVLEVPAFDQPDHQHIEEVARLRLNSGISMDIPVSLLSLELLQILNQLAGVPC